MGASRLVLVSRLALALSAALLCGGVARADDNPWLHRRVLDMAHAGGEHEAPTNTLFAQKLAVRSGADLLEMDVHRSKDGVLVMIHDDTVNRVTNGTGRVADMTLAELKTLDKAYNFQPNCAPECPPEIPPGPYPLRGIATGERPPPPGFEANDFRVAALREVLETFPDELLSIEIKGQPPESLEVARDLADLLREYHRSHDVLVASFDDSTIAAFHARAPEIDTTPGTNGVVFFFASYQKPPGDPVALQVPYQFSGVKVVTPGFVQAAHAVGLAVYPYLEDDTETEAIRQEMLDAGADGLITARPTAFARAVADRGLTFRAEMAVPVDRVRVWRDALWVPLDCPAWAAHPTCEARVAVTASGRTRDGGKVVLARGSAWAPRGGTGLAWARLGFAGRLLLAWFGHLDARLELDPTQTSLAPLDAPLWVERTAHRSTW